VASDGEIGAEDKETTTQPSSETGTEPAPMEGDEGSITELDGGLVTVTPGATSDETSVSSDDADVDAPKDEVTTVSPTSVTVLSIEETDEGVTIVTTMLPAEGEITTAKPADNVEDTTGSQDVVGTTLIPGSDTTTQATKIDGDIAEDQTTQKSEVTTVMTDSESDTITITVGSEAESEATTPKTDLDSTTPKSEVDTTDLPEDAGVRTGVEVTNPAEEGETTTTKMDVEIDPEDEDADDMTDKDEVTTPKTFVDEEDVDGEGRSMMEGSSTMLPGDEDITTPRSESESTVPSVSQEGSTETPETEVTALPIDADEDVEMTTLSQSPPSLGPSSEEPEGSGAPDTEVTSSPVDDDTPSVPEDGTVTTIMPDAVVTLLTTVRPTTQEEAQTEQPEDGEDTTDASSAEEEKSPESESEEGTTLAPEDGGMHEFDCSEFTDAELAFADPNQIPLECRLRPKEGGEPKTVYILIPKEGLDLTRLFDKNVKVVVKDLMIMDISPK